MNFKGIIAGISFLCCMGISFTGCKSASATNEQKTMKEAMDSRNTPQLIKELISEMKNELDIDRDRFPNLILSVEEYAKATTDPAANAVLHSMLAEMYKFYLTENRWNIDQRTEITGFVPEDIREWSTNLFEDKIKEHIDQSLRQANLLQETPAIGFQAIMETGENIQSPITTLYDFLLQRAITLQRSDDLYQKRIAYQKERGDAKEAVIAELDYLQYIYRKDRSDSARVVYRNALDKLLKENASKDYSTEIRSAIISMMDYGYNERTDSIMEAQYKMVKEGISLFPNYERIGLLKNKLAQMEEPYLSSSLSETVYPGDSINVNLNHRNVREVVLTLYESLGKTEDISVYDFNQKSSPGKQIKQIRIPLKETKSYLQADTIIRIPIEEIGLYECILTVPGTEMKNEHRVNVSRMMAVVRNIPGGTNQALVTDYKTGKPLQKATITYYTGQRRDMKVAGTLETDKDGLATLPSEDKIVGFRASQPGDTGTRITYIYLGGDVDDTYEKQVQVSLFTDRGIYRPGQTVYFKGIAYLLNKEETRVASNQSFTVILRDANYKELATKQLRSNTFGSFNGEFTLPKQAMNGFFTISAGNSSTSFRMEEYKRPTFQVEFQPVKDEIVFGDRVNIQGKAETFSGAAMNTGYVQWTVTRSTLFPGMRGGMGASIVETGSTSLSSDGTFSLSFRPEKENNRNFPSQYYTFTITARITDSKGETQETSYSFPVGDTSISLSVDIPQQVEKTSVKASVSAQLLNGEKTTVSGTYSVVSLLIDNPGSLKWDYKEGQQVASGNFTSGEDLPADAFRKLSSGRYRIVLKAKDSKGREIKAQQDFSLYGKQDKRPPFFTRSWLIMENVSVAIGEKAEWTFGTSDKNAYVLYELFDNKKLLKRERLTFNDENKKFSLTYKEEYGDGVSAIFTYIQNGALYVTQVPVTKKQPDRKLTIRPETFRDKLLPGKGEEWKFRITDSDSLTVAAEMLAALYDMSLDKIVPFRWYFSPERSIYIQAPMFRTINGFGYSSEYAVNPAKTIDIPIFVYGKLDWQGIFNMPQNVFYSREASPSMTSGLRMMKGGTLEEASVEMMADQGTVAQGGEGVPNNDTSSPNTPLQLRSNFNETAFFFPTLATNEKGDVLVRFTLPESNTTWKFQAIAHTKDLKFGEITKEVTSSKPLMVLPNLPRFLRQGDKIALSSQILNQGEKEMSGLSRIELFDPATDQPIVCLSKSQRPFTLAAGKQATVQWVIDVPADAEMVGVRIIAESDEASDGEQHLLPVISNQILITESTPFYMLSKGEQQVNVIRPKAGYKPFRLTLEVSGNPVWYAVQALPTISTPTNDNVMDWFASYYANTLASSIAASYPRIQQVIAQWTAQGGTPSTLLSNLEQNEELKNILLEETPWVLEAKNETEQKQRLSLLFDLNRANSQREAARQYLLDRQMEDGGWGWYKGFGSDRMMTLSILKGMSQLVRIGSAQYDQQEKEMQMRALRFLDESMQKDYETLKKYDKNWEKAIPGAEQVEFLYVRSGYRDIPEVGEAREAIRFYTAQAEKNWNKLTLYGKGAIALLMQRNGKKEVAGEIIGWLRKTATTSEEQGMYWANNRRGSDFFISPVDVHTLLMAAFQEITPETKENDWMKQWLLNQKRTQNWGTTPSTLNAIHAILLTGSDWLNNANTVAVQWGNKTYSTTSGETATGYVKETLTGDALTSGTNNLLIRKEGDAPAWGAVYYQYFAPVDQVDAQKGVLNVEKKLFVEIYNGTERTIRPMSSEQPLQVGDKVIVRLTIRNDRDMDYVALKDLRAGCFEPANQLSGYSYKNGVGFYRSPKDVSENFFFRRLPKGTFVLEYPVYVSRSGEYAGGISTIQCMYAPEFVSHTEGGRIIAND